MRKIISVCISLLMIVSLCASVKAETDDNIETIRAFIYTFDNIESDISYVKDLKDINDETSFALYKVDEDGYAVITKKNNNIAEISYGGYPDGNVNYYVSAGDFRETLDSTSEINTCSLDNEDEENDLQSSLDNLLQEEHVEFILESSQEENDSELSTCSTRPYPNKPSVISKGTVVGISDSSMNIFNGDIWVNSKENNSYKQCGAYAAAVMITYMDKYHGGKYFKESGSYSAGNIIERLKKYITGSSTASNIVYAVNSIFLNDYPSGGKHGIVTSSESTYKSKIKSKYPVCLNLRSSKQSPYGNHWVCAYQYVAYNGALWFKAHDNWTGNNHRGWINRNWIYKGGYTN